MLSITRLGYRTLHDLPRNWSSMEATTVVCISSREEKYGKQVVGYVIVFISLTA